jgi:RimJ/RimL family protein N-acetyltransferase
MIEDNRLIGFIRLHHIEWSMGSGWIKLGIANPSDRGKGAGSDALGLGLRYAFNELNLRRLNLGVGEYNLPAIELFKKFGFTEEVRRREVYLRNGRRWDILIFGLLRSEWDTAQKTAGGQR